MNTLKKLLALVLAIAMVMSMSVVGSYATEPNGTVSQTQWNNLSGSAIGTAYITVASAAALTSESAVDANFTTDSATLGSSYLEGSVTSNGSIISFNASKLVVTTGQTVNLKTSIGAVTFVGNSGQVSIATSAAVETTVCAIVGTSEKTIHFKAPISGDNIRCVEYTDDELRINGTFDEIDSSQTVNVASGHELKIKSVNNELTINATENEAYPTVVSGGELTVKGSNSVFVTGNGGKLVIDSSFTGTVYVEGDFGSIVDNRTDNTVYLKGDTTVKGTSGQTINYNGTYQSASHNLSLDNAGNATVVEVAELTVTNTTVTAIGKVTNAAIHSGATVVVTESAVLGSADVKSAGTLKVTSNGSVSGNVTLSGTLEIKNSGHVDGTVTGNNGSKLVVGNGQLVKVSGTFNELQRDAYNEKVKLAGGTTFVKVTGSHAVTINASGSALIINDATGGAITVHGAKNETVTVSSTGAVNVTAYDISTLKATDTKVVDAYNINTLNVTNATVSSIHNINKLEANNSTVTAAGIVTNAALTNATLNVNPTYGGVTETVEGNDATLVINVQDSINKIKGTFSEIKMNASDARVTLADTTTVGNITGEQKIVINATGNKLTIQRSDNKDVHIWDDNTNSTITYNEDRYPANTIYLSGTLGTLGGTGNGYIYTLENSTTIHAVSGITVAGNINKNGKSFYSETAGADGTRFYNLSDGEGTYTIYFDREVTALKGWDANTPCKLQEAIGYDATHVKSITIKTGVNELSALISSAAVTVKSGATLKIVDDANNPNNIVEGVIIGEAGSTLILNNKNSLNIKGSFSEIQMNAAAPLVLASDATIANVTGTTVCAINASGNALTVRGTDNNNVTVSSASSLTADGTATVSVVGNVTNATVNNGATLVVKGDGKVETVTGNGGKLVVENTKPISITGSFSEVQMKEAAPVTLAGATTITNATGTTACAIDACGNNLTVNGGTNVAVGTAGALVVNNTASVSAIGNVDSVKLGGSATVTIVSGTVTSASITEGTKLIVKAGATVNSVSGQGGTLEIESGAENVTLADNSVFTKVVGSNYNNGNNVTIQDGSGSSGGNVGDKTFDVTNEAKTVSGAAFGVVYIKGTSYGAIVEECTASGLIVNGVSVTVRNGAVVGYIKVQNGGSVVLENGATVAAVDTDAVSVEGGSSFRMLTGASITLTRTNAAQHVNDELVAVHNWNGKTDLLGGTITVKTNTGNLNDVAVCNDNGVVVIGTLGTTTNDALTINMDYGTGVRNFTTEAETYIYDLDLSFSVNAANNKGLDAQRGKLVVLAGEETMTVGAEKATQTVSVNVNGGTAVTITNDTAWTISGGYQAAVLTGAAVFESANAFTGSAVYVSAVADKTTTVALNARPLACGVYSNGITGTSVSALMPADNFYFNTTSGAVVDEEWNLRHTAVTGSAFTMPIDIKLDGNTNAYWGAMATEGALNVTKGLALDLDSHTLTTGSAFTEPDNNFVNVTGAALTISGSTGKIEAAVNTVVDVATGASLTVSGGSIIGGSIGIMNHGTIAAMTSGSVFGTGNGIVNEGVITSISGGEVKSSGVALNFVKGTITAITGGKFIGGKGLVVGEDVAASNAGFLKLAANATSGAMFTSVRTSSAALSTLGALLDNDGLVNQEDLTFMNGEGVELGTEVLGYTTVTGATLTKTSTKTSGDALVKAEATDTSDSVTVIRRTVSEIGYTTSAAVNASVTGSDMLYDTAYNDSVIFVKRTATPVAVTLTATTGNAIKSVVAERTVTDAAVSTTIGAAANKESAVLTYKAAAKYDGKLTVVGDTKYTVTVNTEAGWTSGGAVYVYTGDGYTTDGAMTIANVGTEDVTSACAYTAPVIVAKDNTVKVTFSGLEYYQIYDLVETGTVSTTALTTAQKNGRTYTTEQAITTDTVFKVRYCDEHDTTRATISPATTYLTVGKSTTVTVTKSPADRRNISGCAWSADNNLVTFSALTTGTSLTVTAGTVVGPVNVSAVVTFDDGSTVGGLTSTIYVQAYYNDPTPVVSAGGGGGGGAAAPATYSISCSDGVTVNTNTAASGVKVTLTVASGYENPVVKDANGNTIAVSGNTFTMPSSKVTVTVSKAAAQTETSVLSGFTDLDLNECYCDGIEYCVKNGLMGGVGNNLFNPSGTTSRAQIVTILYRLAGSPVVSGAASYSDVEADQYYSNAVAWAEANGVVTGNNGKFNPNGAVTREQLAAMLYRYATLKNYSVSASGNLASFTDANAVSDWAVSAMTWANGAGIVTGSNNQLNAAGTATRAQAAAMFMRFCQNVAK